MALNLKLLKTGEMTNVWPDKTHLHPYRTPACCTPSSNYYHEKRKKGGLKENVQMSQSLESFFL